MTQTLVSVPVSLLDLKDFDAVAARQYEWQIDDNGEIHGLISGDMGYDSTGVTLQALVGTALYIVADEGRETKQWPLHTELQTTLNALIKTARKIISDGHDR